MNEPTIDLTTAPDESHTFGLVFRLFAGNGKELVRWFPSEAEAQRFFVRNNIVPIRTMNSEDKI